MKYWFISALASLLVALTGCASLVGPPPAVGDSEATVVAKRGHPTAQYQVGAERLLEYPTGPMGQETYFAHISPDGKLSTYEQVLTVQKFATIKVEAATKDDVLRTIGHPAETSYLALPELEVWSYRYKENGVWDSMMHVHFDKSGKVRKMLNAPDPRFEREGWFRRGNR
jgi:hypothetical protein